MLSTERTREPLECPELALWRAVILQAVKDGDRAWFASPSFRTVAMLAGFDPDAVASHVLANWERIAAAVEWARNVKRRQVGSRDTSLRAA